MKDKDTHLLEEAYIKIINENNDEDISEDDCIIASNGYSYGITCSGERLGETTDMEEALERVKKWRDDNKWYPTIWFVSDHGNYWPIDEEGNEISQTSDEPYEMSDIEADADTLASAGYGTDEDYGYFGGDEW